MLMALLPVPAPADKRVVGEDGHTQCFDIDAEIEFWIEDFDVCWNTAHPVDDAWIGGRHAR